MAVKDGLPATDFSRMNRKYIEAVVEEAGGGGGGGGGGTARVELTVTMQDGSRKYEIQMNSEDLMELIMQRPVIVYYDTPNAKLAFTVTSGRYNSNLGGYMFEIHGSPEDFWEFNGNTGEKPVFITT